MHGVVPEYVRRRPDSCHRKTCQDLSGKSNGGGIGIREGRGQDNRGRRGTSDNWGGGGGGEGCVYAVVSMKALAAQTTRNKNEVVMCTNSPLPATGDEGVKSVA